MTEASFILVTAHGELSSAEVASYLEAVGVNYRVTAFSRRVAILDAAGLDPHAVMKRSGGLYKVGVVGCVLSGEDVKDDLRMRRELDSSDFYGWLDDKARWCISVYRGGTGFEPSLPDFIQEYFRERLRRDGVKRARYLVPKRMGEEEVDQEIVSDDLVKKRIVNEGLEILVAYISGKYFIGRTLEVVRNQEFLQRDLGRPFQNPKLSIPPKIARILVNLTGLNLGKTLLDPFCGVGTILQEAAVLGLQIFGCDIDGRRVSETVKNLKWLSETHNLKLGNLSERIFKADTRRLSKRLHGKVDGIATEPILLPPLKRFPTEDEAEDMLQRAAEIYVDSLPEMTRVLKKGGRLVLVAPSVRTDRRSEVSFNLEEAFEESGLTLYNPSNLPWLKYPLMPSADKDQKVLRGIYVLENS